MLGQCDGLRAIGRAKSIYHTSSAGRPSGQEQEADCWGFRTLVQAGRLSDEDVLLIQGDLSNFVREDWTHLPGPQRAINLRRCLGNRSMGDSNDSEAERAAPTGPYPIRSKPFSMPAEMDSETCEECDPRESLRNISRAGGYFARGLSKQSDSTGLEPLTHFIPIYLLLYTLP
jgi:hypothetical protein